MEAAWRVYARHYSVAEWWDLYNLSGDTEEGRRRLDEIERAFGIPEV